MRWWYSGVASDSLLVLKKLKEAEAVIVFGVDVLVEVGCEREVLYYWRDGEVLFTALGTAKLIFRAKVHALLACAPGKLVS